MAREKANSRGMNSKGKTVPLPKLTPAKPTEAITAVGQKATGLGKSTKDNRFASTAKTPVSKSTSMSLRGMQGSSSFQPTRGQAIKAASAAATIGAASGFQLVKQTVVSEATKKLQRALSSESRASSNKDIRSMPRAKREEIAYGRATQRETPEEIAEGRASQAELKKKISESMKKTTTTKKTVQKRK